MLGARVSLRLQRQGLVAWPSLESDGWQLLQQLQILNLNGNALTTLPEEFGCLLQLRELLLRDNQLTALPTCLTRLPSLEILWLHNNRLTALPADFGALSKLEGLGADGRARLGLEGNPLLVLPLTPSRLPAFATGT